MCWAVHYVNGSWHAPHSRGAAHFFFLDVGPPAFEGRVNIRALIANFYMCYKITVLYL